MESQHIVTQRFVTALQSLITAGTYRSLRQLALALDYPPQGLHDIFRGKRNVSLELLHRAAALFLINTRYLFSGQGEMFDKPGVDYNLQTRVVVVDNLQRERIVHVPIPAYAGYRDNITEPVFIGELPTYALPDAILRHGSYRSFEVAGDSMEPTLLPGDKVIGAFIEPQYWEQGIKDHAVHVLVTQEDILAKRVVNYIRAEKMIELRSDNSTVAPIHLPVSDLREAWVVRLRITANLSRPNDYDILDEIRSTVASLSNRMPV